MDDDIGWQNVDAVAFGDLQAGVVLTVAGVDHHTDDRFAQHLFDDRLVQHLPFHRAAGGAARPVEVHEERSL
jgi:hypothetical protein